MLGPATTCTIDTTLSQPFDRHGAHTKTKTVSIANYLKKSCVVACGSFLLTLVRALAFLALLLFLLLLFVRLRAFLLFLLLLFVLLHAFFCVLSFVRSFARSLVLCCTWGDQPAFRFLQKAFLPFLTGGAGD